MDMKFDDDEKIENVEAQAETGDADDGETFTSGKVESRYFNKIDAPLKAENFKVLVELTGAEAGEERPGLDVVMVLDVSGSMNKKKRLVALKTASKFVIKKFSPIDRLSIVTFSDKAQRLHGLRRMTPDAQDEFEDEIEKLEAKGRTNITDGLDMAVKVLKQRRFTAGREVAVLLMSDGDPNPAHADGSLVPIEDVPVYTFGLGQDYHPKVLVDLATRSDKGVFSPADVGNSAATSLSEAFSQSLAGLLSVVVQDLTLTIKKEDSEKIVKVTAGDYYKPFENKSDGSFTLSFGNLYSLEKRSILVDVLLAEVTDSQGQDVLSFNFSYKNPIGQQVRKSLPVIINVSRTENPTSSESPEVLMEEARQYAVEKMKEAKEKADVQQFEEAKKEINEAKKEIERKGLDQAEPNVKGLLSELDHILGLLEPGVYEKLGRAFLMAAILSHALQRFAARGDVNELRAFATPAMEKFLEQLNNYEKNPGLPVPTAADDSKVAQEAKNNRNNTNNSNNKDPVIALATDLALHLGNAIESLKAMQDLLNNTVNAMKST